MIKNFKNKIKTILSPFILYQKRDGNIYYGEYIGSFNFWRKFLWNIFHPLRLYNRFRHGQLFRFKKQRAIYIHKNDYKYLKPKDLKKVNEYNFPINENMSSYRKNNSTSPKPINVFEVSK